MYQKNKQDGLYGFMYKHDRGSYPDFKFYQSVEERDEMFGMILITGQVYCEQRDCMVFPYKLYKIEKDESIYTLPIKEVD